MSFYLGNIFEVFLSAGVKDGAGREVGFTIGLRDNGYQFLAWVQNSRRDNGYFYDFGEQEKAREFVSQSGAIEWAFSSARSRALLVRVARSKQAALAA